MQRCARTTWFAACAWINTKLPLKHTPSLRNTLLQVFGFVFLREWFMFFDFTVGVSSEIIVEGRLGLVEAWMAAGARRRVPVYKAMQDSCYKHV
eukprot:580188-Amphidinium_carterae.1